jgi:hypothetical protein
MLLVVQEGHHKSQSYLSTYSIDIDRLRSDKIASAIFSTSFDSTSRTKSNLILLNSKDGTYNALNPKNLSTKVAWTGNDNSWSVNDDFVVNDQS